ncbi:nucleoside triphosphate pyrophosphohydrolase [Bacillus sp. REN16]|uniref:nucleoside triphosphate pyrophosphohydrolase n=1 Tax=Bacillus sp. REN16 TaxID=2887296 RepID=UPI001E64A327|nr:nucleoside triphosphate pyrophosphohydrolase [Bacillus sp. REN16]MCC3357739.1 nucleoside triphosphate pyrophosphohydrolase [Bacillus sp. REN16]
MTVHQKLVRDRIPEIIENTGKKFSTRVLANDEYLIELRKKGFEELEEYVNASDKENALEELADLLEIIHALAVAHESSFNEVEAIRERKAQKRGGFQEKIFLIEVEDD